MKRLLVVRSVSFQQLDTSLGAIRARFPEHVIDVLTHEHGKVLAASYASVSSVIVYPERGPFRRGTWTPPPDVAWDDVVVPVANRTGAGFANVFDFARSLTRGTVHRCNAAGSITALSPQDLRRLVRAAHVNHVAGAILGVPLGVVAACCFTAAAGIARLTGAARAS